MVVVPQQLYSGLGEDSLRTWALGAVGGAERADRWAAHLALLLAHPECDLAQLSDSVLGMTITRSPYIMSLTFSRQDWGPGPVVVRVRGRAGVDEDEQQLMEPPASMQQYWYRHDMQVMYMELLQPEQRGKFWACLTGHDLWQHVGQQLLSRSANYGHPLCSERVSELLGAALGVALTTDALRDLACAVLEQAVPAGDAEVRYHVLSLQLTGDAVPCLILCIWDTSKTRLLTLLLGGAAAFLDQSSQQGLCMYRHDVAIATGLVQSTHGIGMVCLPGGQQVPMQDDLQELTRRALSRMQDAPVQLPDVMSLDAYWVNEQLFDRGGALPPVHAVAQAQLGQVLRSVMGIGNEEVVARQLVSIGGYGDSLLQCMALRVSLGGAPPSTLLYVMGMCGEIAPVLVVVSPEARRWAWPFCATSAAPPDGCVGLYRCHNMRVSRMLCGPTGGPLVVEREPFLQGVDALFWEPQSLRELFADVMRLHDAGVPRSGYWVARQRLPAQLRMVGLPAEQAIADYVLEEIGARQEQAVACYFMVCPSGARIMCVVGQREAALVAQYGALRKDGAMAMVTGAAAQHELGIKEDGELRRTMAMAVQSAAREKLAPRLVFFSEEAGPRSLAFSMQRRDEQLVRAVEGLQRRLRCAMTLQDEALGQEKEQLAAGALSSLATIQELFMDGDIKNYVKAVAAREAAAAMMEPAPGATTPQQCRLCIEQTIEALGMLLRSVKEGEC